MTIEDYDEGEMSPSKFRSIEKLLRENKQQEDAAIYYAVISDHMKQSFKTSLLKQAVEYRFDDTRMAAIRLVRDHLIASGIKFTPEEMEMFRDKVGFAKGEE
jgi:hypothetical protein